MIWTCLRLWRHPMLCKQNRCMSHWLQFINVWDLGLNTTLYNWIQNFLMGSPQAVQIGSITSSTLTLNIGTPQGYVPSPVLPVHTWLRGHPQLHSLLTHHRPDHRQQSERRNADCRILQLLQVHCRDYPDWLHHHLVCQLHRPQP